jgi:hypothetical protein
MAFPLILAGPILRRVDAKGISVWVALSQSQTVSLQVWEGEITGGGAGLITAGAPRFSGSASTIKIGANLHIALVQAPVTPITPLTPETFYSYNLVFNGTQDLQTLGMLSDSAGPPVSLAIGYENHRLPGFFTPPFDVQDLKIAHGSCRKPHGYGKDMLSQVDDVIKKNRTDAHKRPHYLFLTGDQIYADDVALALLPMLTQAGADLLGVTEQMPVSGATPDTDLTQQNFPAGRRGKYVIEKGKFTSDDAESHLLGFGEYCAMYLFAWSNAVWASVFPSKTDVVNLAMRTDLATNDVLTSPGSTADEKAEFKKDLEDAWDTQDKLIKEFKDRLPKVRRVLANVPVQMILDDHEVTDDWYITRFWRDRVLTAPAGVTVIRNALTAYSLFQGWGNDPEKFAGGDYADLLQQASALFGNGAFSQPAADRLGQLFGLGGGIPPLVWNYHIVGGQYEIVVMDTRTHRTYPTRFSPPGLLNPQEIEDQIPELPFSGSTEVLILISAAPVLGLEIFEELIQPLTAGIVDAVQTMKARTADQRAPAEKIRNKLTGAFMADLEAWGFNPAAFEGLLARLQPHKSVLILAGDVHYAFSAHLDYWKQGVAAPTRIVQAVASAYQNENPPAMQFLLNTARLQQIMARNMMPAERFGWKNELGNLNPLNIPGGTKLPPNTRGRLARAPLVVTPEDLPAGVTLNTPPEWSWRLLVETDERPDDTSPGARPQKVRVPPVTPDVDFSNAADGYARSVTRYAEQATKSNYRRIVWNANFGLISFERDAGKLVATHSIYYEVGGDADAYTTHRLPLTTPASELPPTI